MISLLSLVEGRYDYGCVMAQIETEAARKILDFNYQTISEETIYKADEGNFGREIHPHITLKYGLVNSYPEEQMREMLRNTTPFNVEIRGVSIFENEEFDVIKFDVDGKELRALNEMFSMLPNHDEYPEYHPHMTLAYVQKGAGNRFIRSPKKIAKVPVNVIEYSDRGLKTYYNL